LGKVKGAEFDKLELLERLLASLRADIPSAWPKQGVGMGGR